MTTEFKVSLENRPGALAELGEALGDARVNIDALQGIAHGDHGVVRFVADNVAAAEEALSAAGLDYDMREVLAVNVLDEPGMLGDVARVLAAGDINIDSVYVTTGGLVILGVDDLPGAIQVASGMAVKEE